MAGAPTPGSQTLPMPPLFPLPEEIMTVLDKIFLIADRHIEVDNPYLCHLNFATLLTMAMDLGVRLTHFIKLCMFSSELSIKSPCFVGVVSWHTRSVCMHSPPSSVKCKLITFMWRACSFRCDKSIPLLPIPTYPLWKMILNS